MDTGQGRGSLKDLSPASFTVVYFYVFWIFFWFASFYVRLIAAFTLILDILLVCFLFTSI